MAATDFYRNVLGLKPIFSESRMAVYELGPASVLILFVKGATLEPVETPGGTIPPHDAGGAIHVAFAVAEESLPKWRARFDQFAITVASEVTWKQGGTSLYLHDPSGNLVELATPGLWPNYPRRLR
ncbi:VOC family protein [Aureimonas populi]|nr:VOC family protein [Aureimonas populi]